MLSPTNKGSIPTLALIGLINFLFVWKYGARAVPSAGLVAFLVVALQLILFSKPVGERLLSRLRPGYVASGLTLIVVLYTGAVHLTVPLSSLNVDRWSVIHSFLDVLSAGGYPYFAESHLGNPPGPMPVYYVLAYPFDRANCLEVLSAIGPIAGMWWIVRKENTPQRAVAWLLLLGTSPWVYWEILVRSNITTYTVLVLVALVYWYRSTSSARTLWSVLMAAVCTGLLLSTRSVYALVYIPVFGALLWRGHTRESVVLSAVTSIAAFTLTFVPIYLTWPDEFMVMNPFIVQSGFLLPRSWVAGVFVLAFSLLLSPRVRNHPFPTGGFVLFGTVGLYFIYHTFTAGFQAAYFDSIVDLSYFIFCVPFLVYASVGGGVVSGLAELPTRNSRSSLVST